MTASAPAARYASARLMAPETPSALRPSVRARMNVSALLRAATAVPGDAAGKASERRNVQKASGFSGSVPVEFREALENYFNALEKEGE